MPSPEAPEQTVVELVHGLTDDVRQLVTDEIALAKSELKAAAHRGIRVAIGALVAMLGAGVLLIFAFVTLVEWLPNHTFVAGLVGLAGLVLVLELTHSGFALAIPMIVAVAIATFVVRQIDGYSIYSARLPRRAPT